MSPTSYAPITFTLLGGSGATTTSTTGTTGTTTTTTTAPPPTTTTSPPTTTTTAPPPSAEALLQGALITVASYNSTDSHVKNAISDLQSALASSAWSADGNHLASTGGSVFDAMQKAVNDLSGTPSPPSSWNVPGVEVAVDHAARQVAADAIVANACSPKNPPQLASADTALSAGDAQASTGHLAQAIGDYKSAWNDALAAQGHTC